MSKTSGIWSTGICQGPPWQYSGEDSVFSLQGAWVRSLVGELRSCKLHGQKQRHTNNKKDTSIGICQMDLGYFPSMTLREKQGPSERKSRVLDQFFSGLQGTGKWCGEL